MTHPRTLGAAERPLLLIPCAVLIACWKLVVSGPSCGHDFDFHLLSWMEAAQQWRHGVLYPHWVATANYGAGEPRFVFYPPFSWMLGALLGLFSGWSLAPVLFTAIALLSCGVGMYLLAREWLPLDVSARAAALYVLSPYVGFVAYQRTAYGELLAGAFVPLVLLFALRTKPSVVPLALSFAAVWLANAPSGVMAGYMLLFVTVVAAIREKPLQLVARVACGSLLGLGLTAFYLVPAAFERRWVQIERAVGPGMRVEDSFLYGHTGEPFHDQVLRTASSIAVFMLAISIAAAAALLSQRQDGELARQFRNAKRLWMPAIALVPLVLFLLLPLSKAVWAHAPELAFLQFPWRWLLIESIVYALLAAAVFRASAALPSAAPPSAVPPRSAPPRAAVLRSAPLGGLLTLLLLGAILPEWFYQPCDEEDAVAAQIVEFKTGNGVEGTDEYVSRNADNGAIQKGLPEVRVLPSADGDAIDSAVAMNPQWSPAGPDAPQPKIYQWSVEHKLVEIQAGKAGFAVLRLMDYPSWRVDVNGIEASPRPHREDGLLTVPIPVGVSRIDVSYRATEDVWLGRLLTLAALLVTVLIAAAGRREPRPGQVS